MWGVVDISVTIASGQFVQLGYFRDCDISIQHPHPVFRVKHLQTPSHGKSLVHAHLHVDAWVVTCRYNRLVGQNATSLSRRFTRLHGLQPLLLTELTAMDMARKASLTTLTTLAHRCTTVTQAFVDQVLCRLLIIKSRASQHPCELYGLSISQNVCMCI